jgi:hemolysin activation/secretion protein
VVAPLTPFWQINSSLATGVDYKSYRSRSIQDRLFQATIFVPESGSVGPPFVMLPSPPISSSRTVPTSVRYLPIALNWDGARQDKWGVTSFNLYNSFNFAGLFGNQDDFRNVAGSQKADGNFYIANAGITREQKLVGDWAVRIRADGQWANQPLISNEQFGLGGNAGVRGYRDGQEYGDTGWRLLFEPHTPLFNVGMVDGRQPMFMRFSLFADYGERYLLDPGPVRQRAVSMLGAGLGFTSTIGEHFDFRLTLGVPLRDTATISAGSTRVTFSFGAQF